jgi:hypothetical protein
MRMAQSIPRGEPRLGARLLARFRRRGADAEPATSRGKPVTEETLRRLATGGPWESDDEFQEFLDTVAKSRS